MIVKSVDSGREHEEAYSGYLKEPGRDSLGPPSRVGLPFEGVQSAPLVPDCLTQPVPGGGGPGMVV